jgi:glycine cleavage system aminomethyltransferase T
MKYKSLQDKLDHVGNPVAMLRDSQVGPYVYPIPSEFSNWRDEQRAWRETVALMDQSYHMTDLYVRGPDVKRLISELGINTLGNFGRNKAKQFVACNHEGYVVGDMILFGLEEDEVNIVGRPAVANWVQFNAETGGYKVEVDRDERTVTNPKPRKTFRFELQGPNAVKLLEKLNGGPLEDIKFFNMGQTRIAGRTLRALKHGMGGAPGLEFWGPVEQGPEVKAAILEAGKEFGLRQIGGRAYGSVAVESGWIPSPMPAIYAGEKMRPYREWLKADSFESMASLGGSFYSDRIEDYYFTPWDLDYGRLIKFDHDFVGRDALKRMADQPHRRKVTLEWNADDVLAIYSSLLHEGSSGKFMEMPTAHYATLPFDKVLSDGKIVGVSTYPAYTVNEKTWLSLAVVDEPLAHGSAVTVLWGEENGGSKKPVVERHVQKEIRATVNPWPFSKVAREQYRPGGAKAK